MSVYEDLLKEDWVRFFEEDIAKMTVRFDRDGKFKAFKRLVSDIPWLHTKSSLSEIHNKCATYQVYFAERMGFIHSVCHECYKVVARPRTVRELFRLYDLQREWDHPGKCGIENRLIVPRLYGGYWYNRGLDDGLKCHREAEQRVHDLISPDMEVILKKGCTEFEMKYGPSDLWKIHALQYDWERKFSEIFVEDVAIPNEFPLHLSAYIQRRWLQFAANNGDMTYLNFTDGKEIPVDAPPKFQKYCEYVTYHKETPCLVLK